MALPNEKLNVIFSKLSGKMLDDNGCMTLNFSDCDKVDLALINELAEQAKRFVSTKAIDYSRYFGEVKACRMYKPGNPAQAIRQVAKTHKLDLEGFVMAFKAAHGVL